MIWKKYSGVKVALKEEAPVKRRYSITADIISYQRCPRQYGFFAIKGYAPANAVQMYFGTVIHEVLDRIHSQYRGLLDPAKKGKIPTDEEVTTYFRQVEDSLKARGIKAIKTHVSDYALKLLLAFNKVEGPALYPRVKETEYALQADEGGYILRGNVDVLIEPKKTDVKSGEVEIWDYKGQKFPRDKTILDQYEFQMQVYAELYKEREGFYPSKAVLYFMDELDFDISSSKRPDKAYYEVKLDPQKIQDAIKNFELTVNKIEMSRKNNIWLAPKMSESATKETCDICDFRWSCTSHKTRYQERRIP